MFLSTFIHSKLLFQTLTQTFYLALSHVIIRTRNKISAGVLINRGRSNYTRGRGCKKKTFRKNFTVPKIVPKNSHSISLYIQTNYRMLLPILIH